MTRLIGILGGTCAVAVAAAWAPLDRPVLQNSFGELDRLVAAELDRLGAPGAAVAVVGGNNVVFAKGYGEVHAETHAAVTTGTLFQIGSVTKSLTALTLASAAVDGAVALDRPVGTFVSGLRACVGAPTLSQLLSHSGGVIDEPDEFGPGGEDGLAAYPRTWTDEYCLLPPGLAFSYSNSGFALAGLALEEAQKRPFADVVRSRVLDPLGMTRTTFRPTEAMTWPLAVGHRRRDGRADVVRPLPNDARLWPAGTLYSSADDMARFLLALVNDGRVGGRQAVPARAVRELLVRRMPMPTVGSSYGYGLELDTFHGQERAGHGGTMTGYAAVLGILPGRRVGAIVLANGDGALMSRVLDRALELAPGDPLPPEPVVAPAPRALPLSAAALDRYAGTFTNPRRFTVEVRRQGDTLLLGRFGREDVMRPVASDRFAASRPGGGEDTIVFGFDSAGQARYLQMYVWALAKKR